MSTIKAMNEAIWLRGLVSDLGLQQKGIFMFCDNQSVTHSTKNKCIMKGPCTLICGIISFEGLLQRGNNNSKDCYH